MKNCRICMQPDFCDCLCSTCTNARKKVRSCDYCHKELAERCLCEECKDLPTFCSELCATNFILNVEMKEPN